jgi:hypothetical protein
MDLTFNELGLVIAVLLFCTIIYVFFYTPSSSSEGSRGEMANVDEWKWDPKEYTENGAYESLLDHGNSFTGEMNSIGFMFSCTYSPNPAWFSSKEQFLDFIETSYLYLTDKYRNLDKEFNSLEHIEAVYENVVIAKLVELQKQNAWSVDDVIKILKNFSSSEEDEIGWFTFRYVCYEGDDVYCFREDFRSDDGGDTNDAPISDDELEAFKVFMADRPNRVF